MRVKLFALSKPRRRLLASGALFFGIVGTIASTSPAEASSFYGKVQGLVADKSGACPNLSFTVLGTRITTDESTHFKRGGCQDIANGRTVKVKAPLRATEGSRNAFEIKFKR